MELFVTVSVVEGATVGLGETINYTITVKNDGNVPYTGVKVVDDLAGLQIHEDEMCIRDRIQVLCRLRQPESVRSEALRRSSPQRLR